MKMALNTMFSCGERTRRSACTTSARNAASFVPPPAQRATATAKLKKNNGLDLTRDERESPPENKSTATDNLSKTRATPGIPLGYELQSLCTYVQ